MALTDKLTNIADAIRGKTGDTEAMTLDQMAEAIAGIETGGGGGAQVLTYTAASNFAAIGLVLEIEHGLGKIPTAFFAVNESWIDAISTDTNHHTWLWACGRNYNMRTAGTAPNNLVFSPKFQQLGIADNTSNICYADTEKIYLICEDWRGGCAGETISIYVWE